MHSSKNTPSCKFCIKIPPVAFILKLDPTFLNKTPELLKLYVPVLEKEEPIGPTFPLYPKTPTFPKFPVGPV